MLVASPSTQLGMPPVQRTQPVLPGIHAYELAGLQGGHIGSGAVKRQAPAEGRRVASRQPCQGC